LGWTYSSTLLGLGLHSTLSYFAWTKLRLGPALHGLGLTLSPTKSGLGLINPIHFYKPFAWALFIRPLNGSPKALQLYVVWTWTKGFKFGPALA